MLRIGRPHLSVSVHQKLEVAVALGVRWRDWAAGMGGYRVEGFFGEPALCWAVLGTELRDAFPRMHGTHYVLWCVWRSLARTLVASGWKFWIRAMMGTELW